MSKPNWFVGIPIAGVELAARISEPPSGIRRFHPEDLHLTVAFLGMCGEERARAGWDALVWTLPALDVTFGAIVPMGNPRRYSALSAVLDEGRADVEAAMSASRDAVCDAAGVPREMRPAKAHVTVARPARSTTDGERRVALRWAAAIDLRGVRVRLSEAALYTWNDDRASRLFRAVATRPFPP
ncbi:hypothetical protein [Sandaracinus amylolyticus]|uniref:hypothetical protein n=1 Tax=Sandaracinus amylolyticus TaxID=927083 RepID=UPI001F200064|nr:hypothetical protein [Sandaracinus amylolyticus]UJR78675.1 RNA 2',3'-cyclic phosphodiesterase [Sandaracinus amylolyticus]